MPLRGRQAQKTPPAAPPTVLDMPLPRPIAPAAAMGLRRFTGSRIACAGRCR